MIAGVAGSVAEKLANVVGLVSLGFGAALTVAPRRSGAALGMSGGPTAYDVLAPLLGSHDPSLVAGAIDGLAELGDARAAPLIQALLAAGRLDDPRPNRNRVDSDSKPRFRFRWS